MKKIGKTIFHFKNMVFICLFVFCLAACHIRLFFLKILNKLFATWPFQAQWSPLSVVIDAYHFYFENDVDHTI